VYDALFAHYGVRRVRSLDEFMDTLELFAPGWRPRPGAIAATLDSGGERGMLVDLAETIGVPFAEIGPATVAKLAETLDPGLEPTNPLDAWGTGNDLARIYGDCLLALDADQATGLNVFNVDLMRASNLPPTYIDITLPILPRFAKPFIFMVNLTSAANEEQMDRLRRAGVPVLMGTETGLRAIRHLLEYSESRTSETRIGESRNDLSDEGLSSVVAVSPIRDSPIRDSAFRNSSFLESSGPVDEFRSKQILSAYGLPVPVEEIAETVEDAVSAAERIGYPVVLKTAEGLMHKTDRGGLVLDLHNPEAARRAYETLAARFGPRRRHRHARGRGADPRQCGGTYSLQVTGALMMGLVAVTAISPRTARIPAGM
jgi:acyl-CoA synthetase (NDP forming)